MGRHDTASLTWEQLIYLSVAWRCPRQPWLQLMIGGWLHACRYCWHWQPSCDWPSLLLVACSGAMRPQYGSGFLPCTRLYHLPVAAALQYGDRWFGCAACYLPVTCCWQAVSKDLRCQPGFTHAHGHPMRLVSGWYCIRRACTRCASTKCCHGYSVMANYCISCFTTS